MPAPHSLRVPPQVVAQVPPEQTWPAGQEVPQVPQLALSVCRLAQYAAPPFGSAHWVRPLPQVVVQTPAVQAWPSGQVVPQVPQLALSVCRLAQ